MKTEKRQAKVGERILVTNGSDRWGDYKNGDIFTAREWEGLECDLLDPGDVMAEELEGASYIGPDEYEVIIEEDDHAETNEA